MRRHVYGFPIHFFDDNRDRLMKKTILYSSFHHHMNYTYYYIQINKIG